MEIIYYRTLRGHVPAKAYLTPRYAIGENDTSRMQLHKVKTFTKVESVIKMAADNKGIAGGQFSSALKGYDFQELRLEEGDELVRILYISYHQEQLVLLNAYDKPALYEKALKKKIDKEIEIVHKQTQGYYEDFLRNPKQYEKYE